MGSLEDDITPFAREALDLFGETITIHNDTFLGEDPDEGTFQWDDEAPFDVQGRVLQNQRPMEEGDNSSQQVTGEYHIFVPSTTDVRDGRGDNEVRASEIVDSSGNIYDVIRVTDEHNGLIRCQCTMEGPENANAT